MNDSHTSLPPETPRTVLFRCDGTSQTGLGHASRSLALAEAFVDLGCGCSFVGRFDAPVQERLRTAGMVTEALDAESWSTDDAAALTDLTARRSACGVVIDSYLVGADYAGRIEDSGAPVLLIDDFAALPHYPCSAVLNFTSRADEYAYPCDNLRCFLGPRWFLGRRGLRQLRAQGPRPVRDVRHALVTSGGSDPHDILLPAIDALLACDPQLSLHAVVPAGYAARVRLEALLARFRGETRVLSQLPDLSSELEWADVCIAGAGLTKYEAAYLGVPSGVLSQNEGQARDTVRFASLGMALDLGLASQIDRASLNANVRRLVQDRELRESLQRHSLAVFPEDPTRDLAVALLSEVFLVT
jgi:spore coat polysaccharide biosynthesis predicted glycosyltransferase SpsG